MKKELSTVIMSLAILFIINVKHPMDIIASDDISKEPNATTKITLINFTNQDQEIEVTAPNVKHAVTVTIKSKDSIEILAPSSDLYGIYDSWGHDIFYAGDDPKYFSAHLYPNGWVITNTDEPPKKFVFRKNLRRDEDIDLDVSLTYPNGTRRNFKLPVGEWRYQLNLPYIRDERGQGAGCFVVNAKNSEKDIDATARFQTNTCSAEDTIRAPFSYGSFAPNGEIRMSTDPANW